MSNKFNDFKLGDVSKVFAGGDKPKNFSVVRNKTYKIPVYANAEANNGLLGYTDIPKILESAVTVSARGSNVGFVAIRKEPYFPIVRLLSLIPKKTRLDVNYLFYKLKQNRQNGTGSGQPQITVPDISNKIISLPSLPTQQKIAAVLSALDDKIELNNRINAELEAMAKTLYDYWFVQFDFPNAQGKPYKSSGGKMVYNETLKRAIPEGWEVKSLYKIADFINGLACQKFRPDNEYDDFLPVIKIREMNDGKNNNTERARVNIPEKNIINDGDVLFAWSASLDVKIWTEGKGALNQHIFKVVSKDFPRSFYYFELLNYLKHFKMMAELRKTTMGHITIDHLKTSYISIPPKNLIEKLDNKLNILIERIIINKKQNQELSSLRDWLLPMLMNGQVTVG